MKPLFLCGLLVAAGAQRGVIAVEPNGRRLPNISRFVAVGGDSAGNREYGDGDLCASAGILSQY
jgi:hypothetical protein